jgi:hypothetical protein
MTLAGAREGAMTAFRRIGAAAMARDLRAFVVPGREVARAAGIDLEAAGVLLAASPREASVLVIAGGMPERLAAAAAVAYAQMPRPRAILALGGAAPAPLPAADVVGPLTSDGLIAALGRLRQAFATGAFREGTGAFSARLLETRTEYTCPMHAEIVRLDAFGRLRVAAMRAPGPCRISRTCPACPRDDLGVHGAGVSARTLGAAWRLPEMWDASGPVEQRHAEHGSRHGGRPGDRRVLGPGTGADRVTLDSSRIAEARLETASALHLALVPPLAKGRELGEALTAVASLDQG